MKKLLLFCLLSILTSNLFALTPRTLGYVCKRIASNSYTIKCLNAGRDAYLDEFALGACDRITSDAYTVKCVKAIANKYYTQDEVYACDGVTSNAETVKCFKATGSRSSRPYPRPTHPQRRPLKKMVENALNAFYNGNYDKVGRILERMSDRLNSY